MFYSKINSMKKIQIFALAALLLGFASCSKELETGADGNQNGASGFQINLQSAKGVLTYADIASTAEWDFGPVNVFLFDKTSGALLGTNANFDITTATGTATLTAKADWLTVNKGAFVNVYFVGNNALANLWAQSAQATGLATEAAFIEQVTEAQELDASDNNLAKLLTTPLLFSTSAKNIQVPAVGLVKVDATLKRREARFDIVNPDQANFTVTKVLVSNANLQGFVFADATTNPTFAKASLKEISPKPYDATDATLMPSVFYLYPTQLGDTKTEITIFGTLNGEEKIFEVKSTANIEANKRYKLVFDAAALVFTVVAADYDEGFEFPTELLPEGAISFGTVVATVPDNYAGAKYFFDNHAGTITVPINSVHGTIATVAYLSGNQADLSQDVVVSAPTTTVTYGVSTRDAYTITVPQTNEDGPFLIEVKFASKVDDTKYICVHLIKAHEIPATENILAVDGSGVLNLDGNGTQLYFKWGSLIGIGAGSGIHDVFDSPDVLWAPAGYNMAALKTSIDGAADATAAWLLVPYGTSGYAEMPPLTIGTGRGDPCTLAAKAGHSVGDFRMPTGNPYEQFYDDGYDYSTLSRNSTQGQVYPSAGYRHNVTGKLSYYGVYGIYWTSDVPSVSSAYNIRSDYDKLNLSYSMYRNYAAPIRCVPK